MILFTSLFGDIKNPFTDIAPKYAQGVNQNFGLIVFLTNILRLVFVLAGLYAFLNIVLAGIGFISAGGDSKAVSSAWAKIWQSLLGLLIIAASFVLAAIFGQLLLGSWDAILNPKLYGPGD